MIRLHIEHTVANFDEWKAGFDNFEEFRKKSGVRRYQISHPIDKPNFIMIDLEFEQVNDAEGLLAGVQEVWKRVNGTLIHDPQWHFAEVIEIKELR
jgi:hypothetical protein